jgi:TolB-like protein
VCSDATPDSGADVPESFLRVQWTRLRRGETTPEFVRRISTLLSPGENRAGLATRPPAGTPSSATPLRGAKAVPLTIAVLALFGAGYFALDRLVLSKRAPTLGATSLRGDSAATPVNEKSIAVLPFIDLSEKKDQEYFSDGLAEELLDLLAKTPGLHVIARTSSFSFKGKPDDIPTIGRKLNVANILEGSVRKSGNRLRVTTQLVGANNGEHIWSETYDRELKDVFAVQDEIAAAVVGQLKLKLTPATPSAARRTANVEAYNQYLLGQHSYNSENLEGWRRAVEAFHKAIALDPNYVAPYDGLALVEYQLAGHTGDAAGNQRAQDAAARAVELGPDDPNGYSARGYIRYAINWDWRGAQEDFEKAIALDPGDAQFQLRYGELLGTLGRLPEAIAATRKGIELDPLLAAGWESLAQYLTYTRDFTAAHQVSRRALEISPESTFALNALGWLQLSEGNARDAVATFRKIDEEVFRLYGTSMAEHTLKDPAQSQRALEQLIAKNSADSAYQIADVYAWRGEKDQAFAWLNRAYEQRDGGLTQVKFDPLLNSLRSDPRYTAFLRKMNLPE